MNGLKRKRSETEVLVVGAGPTGLMAAGELARCEGADREDGRREVAALESVGAGKDA